MYVAGVLCEYVRTLHGDDSDGDLDLVLGDITGNVHVVTNLGTLEEAQYGEPQKLQLGSILGGQLDKPPLTMSSWFTGIPSVSRLTFLGPKVGDESIEDVVEASKILKAKEITFMETRISRRGQRSLRTQLSDVELEFIVPVFDRRRGLHRPR